VILYFITDFVDLSEQVRFARTVPSTSGPSFGCTRFSRGQRLLRPFSLFAYSGSPQSAPSVARITFRPFLCLTLRSGDRTTPRGRMAMQARIFFFLPFDAFRKSPFLPDAPRPLCRSVLCHPPPVSEPFLSFRPRTTNDCSLFAGPYSDCPSSISGQAWFRLFPVANGAEAFRIPLPEPCIPSFLRPLILDLLSVLHSAVCAAV